MKCLFLLSIINFIIISYLIAQFLDFMSRAEGQNYSV